MTNTSNDLITPKTDILVLKQKKQEQSVKIFTNEPSLPRNWIIFSFFALFLLDAKYVKRIIKNTKQGTNIDANFFNVYYKWVFVLTWIPLAPEQATWAADHFSPWFPANCQTNSGSSLFGSRIKIFKVDFDWVGRR